MNNFSRLLLVFGFLMGTVMTAEANVPPPPVNQNIGINDTVFNQQAADQTICRGCHNTIENDPPGVPVEKTYLPTRHHQLVGTPLDGDPETPAFCQDGSDWDPSCPDTTLNCLNCHDLTPDPDFPGENTVNVYRECAVCHDHPSGEVTVHHATLRAQEGRCLECHGRGLVGGVVPDSANPSLVAGQRGGQAPPDYQPSIVTPWPSFKDGGDSDPLGVRDFVPNPNGIEAGNCVFCHATPDNSVVCGAEDGPRGVVVCTNQQNHHETGLFYDTPDNDFAKCLWCHNELDATGDGVVRSAQAIRTCENCHDRRSIHSIEFDAVGDGVQPGQEDRFMGHIGNQDNCWGCHGNDGVPLPPASSVTGATTPSLDSTSTKRIFDGATMTVNGNGFINTDAVGAIREAGLLLTDADGNETLLAAEAGTISSTSMDVVIPGTVPAGNYRVQAAKGWAYSNPLFVTVMDSIVVDSATCSGGTVTLAGSGFDNYLDANNSGTSVSATVNVCTGKKRNRVCTDTTQAGSVSSWSDTDIVASFDACPATVDVSNVYTQASADVTSDDPAPTACSDNGDEASCLADSSCEWSVNKKGRGSCKDAGGGDTGGNNGGGNNGGGKNK